MPTSERTNISERLRLRQERPAPVAAAKPDVKRMKTSIFIDPDVMEQIDAAFDAYNYENRDARVKKAAFFEQVLAIGMQHADEVAAACREIGGKTGRGAR